MKRSNDGAATESPSTADKTEIAGVMIPSPKNKDAPMKPKIMIASLFPRDNPFCLRFKASNAMIPPSPLLSALMITKTYLSETIKVMVQKIKERIPRILSSLIGSPRVA